MADVKYVITADISGATKEFKKLEGILGDMKTQAKKSISPIKGLYKQFALGAGYMAGAVVAFQSISRAVEGFTQFLGNAVGAANEYERATAQLESVLKSTGGVAGLTKDALISLADSMQNLTTYSNTQVLAAENLLLTFTKIGREIFPEATQIVLDMSTALGQDLKSSAIQLGKALNDPVQGVTALKRVGVSFTQSQMDMIKSLVESGKTLEAQKLILAELKTEFGGASKAAAETFSGSIQQLKNSYGDLVRQIGETITHTNEFRDAIKLTKQILDDLVSSGLIPQIAKDLKDFSSKLILVRNWADSFRLVSVYLKNAAAESEYYANVGRGLALIIGEVDKQLLKFGIDVLDLIPFIGRAKEEHDNLGGAIDSIVSLTETQINTFNSLIVGYDGLIPKVEKLTEVYKQSQGFFDDYVFAVEETLPAARNMKDVFLFAVDEMKTGVGDLANDVNIKTEEMKNYFDGFYNDIAQAWANTIQNWLEGSTTFKDFMTGMWEDVKSVFFKVIGEMIAEWSVNFAKNILADIKNIGSSIAENITGAAKEGASAITTTAQAAGSLASTINVVSMAALGLAGIISAFKKGPNLDYTNKLLEEQNWVYLTALNEKLDDTNDKLAGMWSEFGKIGWGMKGFLREIRDNTFLLRKLKFAQSGINTTVTRPTLFVAGERGPERVTITPTNRRETYPPIQITNHIHIQTVDAQSFEGFLLRGGARKITEMIQMQLNAGRLRIPINVVGG